MCIRCTSIDHIETVLVPEEYRDLLGVLIKNKVNVPGTVSDTVWYDRGSYYQIVVFYVKDDEDVLRNIIINKTLPVANIEGVPPNDGH
jgi:hypothetical protein